METINDRIQVLVDEHFDGNKAAFAKAIGIAPTSISNYLGKQRASKPSVDMIVKIINSLNVDALWILTGRKSGAGGINVKAKEKQTGATFGGNVNIGDSAVLKDRIKAIETTIELNNTAMDKTGMLQSLINFYTDGNKAKFAALLGVNAQNISAWLARNTFDAELIYTKCKEVSADWLLSGEGDMLRSQQSVDTDERSRRFDTQSMEIVRLCKALVENYKQRDDVMGKLVSIFKNI